MATAEETAERIEDVRVTMRRLYGDRWPDVSAAYREILEGAMRGSGETNVLRAVLPLAQELDRRGLSPLALLATAGDMASSANKALSPKEEPPR
jgi:hypothetical protein